MEEQFLQEILENYTFEDDSLILGGAMYQGKTAKDHLVRIPLSMLNRHGLIAGSTGTGKTKTLQVIAEQMSRKGIPTLLMDVKGDLSGIGAPSPGGQRIIDRNASIGIPFTASSSPVELLSLSEEPGARLRATVFEFGPVLLAKILTLTDVQEGVLTVIFKYCEDQNIPLVDLNDLKKTLQYVTDAGKDAFRAEYGMISTQSVGGIVRKIVGLEQQGADLFFGEPSFDVDDLLRIDENGRGIVSIVRLTDLQDRPKLFSTFMIQLLAEIYATYPEEGDIDRPKLCMFIDEAHLVFENASDALVSQIETIIKLIRSKGVGIFFVTQNPTDIPDAVLGQLGLKVQHALRAFTAKDRKAIKLAAQNFPISEYYNVEQLLTELGTGEALVTALNPKGRPTPLVRTMLRAPESRMDILTDKEIDTIVSNSRLVQKYAKTVDRESAYEILTEKIELAKSEEQKEKMETQRAKETKKRSSREKSTIEKMVNNPTTRSIGNTIAREVTRGLLGALGIKTTRRRSSKKGGGLF